MTEGQTPALPPPNDGRASEELHPLQSKTMFAEARGGLLSAPHMERHLDPSVESPARAAVDIYAQLLKEDGLATDGGEHAKVCGDAAIQSLRSGRYSLTFETTNLAGDDDERIWRTTFFFDIIPHDLGEPPSPARERNWVTGGRYGYRDAIVFGRYGELYREGEKIREQRLAEETDPERKAQDDKYLAHGVELWLGKNDPNRGMNSAVREVWLGDYNRFVRNPKEDRQEPKEQDTAA